MTLVLLDRDGVINIDSDSYVCSVEDWQPIPGSIEAIVRLKRAGFKVAVCTNQSGIARRMFTKDDLFLIHAKMQNALRASNVTLDAIYYCPHGPQDNCKCRKPMPGMLLEAMKDLGHEKTKTWFVGDSFRDIQAASRAGCPSILVQTGNGTTTEPKLKKGAVTKVCDDLAHASRWLLSKSGTG